MAVIAGSCWVCATRSSLPRRTGSFAGSSYHEEVRSLCLLWCVALSAEETFKGVLDPVLVPSLEETTVELKLADQAQRASLRDWVWPTEPVWASEVRGALALILDRMDGKRVLYVDVNRDYVLTPDEAVPGSVVLFDHYPVRVRLTGNQIHQSMRALVRGVVNVDGKNIPVQYEADRTSGKPAVDRGLHAVGGVAALAAGKAPVFAAGDRFVSAAAIDVQRGEVALRSHPSSEMPVFDVLPGRLFPEFTFVDTKGSTRNLSEFRGRYVLLDFWASWCPPCRSDFDHLRRAYDKHRSKLELIGMNGDAEPEQAARMLAEQRPPWTQAVSGSIRDLIDNRLRLYRYPAYVLLDGDGRVVWSLTGELGEGRLERLLVRALSE